MTAKSTTALTPTTPTPEENPLKSLTTKDLLQELFSRYREGLFIAHSSDKSNPIQIGCHFPTKMTGMHSVLTGALRRILTGLEKKYPDLPIDEQPNNGMIIDTEVSEGSTMKTKQKMGSQPIRCNGMPHRATMNIPEATSSN